MKRAGLARAGKSRKRKIPRQRRTEKHLPKWRLARTFQILRNEWVHFAENHNGGFESLHSWNKEMKMHRFWKVYMHIIWATSQRSHVIKGPLEKEMHAAIREAVRDMSMVPVCVNSAWNHTHSLVSWNPAVAIDSAVEAMKEAAVERWQELRKKSHPDQPRLELQKGFSVFSIHHEEVDTVKQYIARQKKHHSSGKIVESQEIWQAPSASSSTG